MLKKLAVNFICPPSASLLDDGLTQQLFDVKNMVVAARSKHGNNTLLKHPVVFFGRV